MPTCLESTYLHLTKPPIKQTPHPTPQPNTAPIPKHTHTQQVPRSVIEADLEALLQNAALPYEGYDAFEEEDHFIRF